MSQYHYLSLPNVSADEADIIVLPVAYEETVSAKGGTSEGPRALLDATDQLEFYEEDQQWCPMKHMQISVQEEISKEEGESTESYNAKVQKVVASLPISSDKLFVGIGGEHSITPLLTAERMKERGTILFLDAHADLREHYEGNPYSHACPVNHLRNQGHKILMAGIRSIFEKEAERIATDDDITCFFDRMLQRSENRAKFMQSVASLEGPVWLSIDMDAFNPALVPGVGTPQPGGLDWYFALDTFEALFFNPKVEIIGVDILELVPEPTNVSQVFAAKLLQKIISFWGKANAFDAKPMSGAQMQVEYD